MSEVFSLQGRRALVTGAGSGIGRAIAQALTGAGARVAVTDLDLSAARLSPPNSAGRARLRLDVTDAAATDAAIERVADRLGGLEIVCANAGVSTMNRVVDLTEEEWDHNMAVNAKGVFLTNQAAVRHWLARGARA